jgi:DNA-binding transcriptional LysR family regulator
MTEAQLRALVAVVETGSFRAAATRLHMSQPGVSRAVRALEDELGQPLLTRGRGSVEPTELGERVLRRSRAVLAETEAMRQEPADLQGVFHGRIRLGSMPSVSATLLPRLLARFDRRHPGVEVAVIDGHDDELVEWVRAETVDVAVVAGNHEGLELTPLYSDEFLAVIPRSHVLAEQEAVARRDFADHPFILTRAGCERLVLEALREAGVVPPISHEVTEGSSILAMVAEGLGVSIMPALAARRPPRSVALRPLLPAAVRQLSLATLAARTTSPAVRALLTQVTPPTRSARGPGRLGRAARSSGRAL